MTEVQKEEIAVTDESVEDAAYLAEMAGDAEVPSGESEEEGEVTAEANAETDKVEGDAAQTAEEARKEVIAGYTEEEIRAALEQLPRLQKALDTTNGTLGSRLAEQQKKLEELSAARQSVGKLSADKMTRLSKDFPELAELLAEDLNDVIAQGGQSDASQLAQDFDAKLNALREEAAEKERKLAEKEQARELRDLSKVHKDWREVAGFNVQNDQVIWNNPQFGSYVATLPREEQARLLNVWDADFVTEKISGFKATIKPKAADKKKIIEDATLPQGSKRTVASDDLGEEEAAFRAEMAKR